jgi:chemotaxis signal transduction protein
MDDSRRAGGRFLVVRLAGREFAVPAGRVRGTIRAAGLALEPVEGRGRLRYLLGAEGATLPVFVLNSSLGVREQRLTSRSCVVLMAGGALLVDSISRVQDAPGTALRMEGGRPTHVRLGDKWREVIDLDGLVPD